MYGKATATDQRVIMEILQNQEDRQKIFQADLKSLLDSKPNPNLKRIYFTYALRKRSEMFTIRRRKRNIVDNNRIERRRITNIPFSLLV